MIIIMVVVDDVDQMQREHVDTFSERFNYYAAFHFIRRQHLRVHTKPYSQLFSYATLSIPLVVLLLPAAPFTDVIFFVIVDGCVVGIVVTVTTVVVDVPPIPLGFDTIDITAASLSA